MGFFDIFSSRNKKTEQRADDVARQAREALEREAASIRQATSLSPGEESLRGNVLSTLQGRLGVPGETLFSRQGPVSAETAAQLLRRIQTPGLDFESTTGQETQKALEEGLYPTLARRGISPTSPLAITEGRREARDVAIQSAQRRLNQMNTDINRGFQFGGLASGLESEARGAGQDVVQQALARMAQGATSAGQLAGAGISQSASIQQQANQQAAEYAAQVKKRNLEMLMAALASIGGAFAAPGGMLGAGGSVIDTSKAFQLAHGGNR